jgi:hypothetical protein
LIRPPLQAYALRSLSTNDEVPSPSLHSKIVSNEAIVLV